MKNSSVKSATVKNTTVTGKSNVQPVTGKADSKEEQTKVNGLPVSGEFESKGAEAPKAEGTITVTEAKVPEAGEAQAKVQEEQPKIEPAKEDPKAEVKEEKPALNLELTLKMVKDLFRLSNQRDKLITTIDDLEAFEVAQQDDAEETDINHFQACVLTIRDDKGRDFTTKNPYIINLVAKDIKALCLDKLGEVESHIAIPS